MSRFNRSANAFPAASCGERSNRTTQKGAINMKKEDIWMMILVVFSMVFTASFGWGVWG